SGLPGVPPPRPGGGSDWPAVAVSAEPTALNGLFREGLPATQAAIAQLGDSQIAARATTGLSPAMRDRSVAYGAALGRAILDWAAADRFAETRGQTGTPPRGRQYWVNTGDPSHAPPTALT